MLDGKVIGECLPRRRRQVVLKFLRKIDRETPLELYLIRDNYPTHKHEQVKKRASSPWRKSCNDKSRMRRVTGLEGRFHRR